MDSQQRDKFIKSVLKSKSSKKTELTSQEYNSILSDLYQENLKLKKQLENDLNKLNKSSGHRTKSDDEHYKCIFEDSPIAIWEEDFSEYKAYLERLRKKGTTDIRKYLRENPDEAVKCLGMLKVRDVNKAALELYRVETKKQLLGEYDSVYWRESFTDLIEGIILFAEGNLPVELETVNFTTDNRRIFVKIRATVATGYEDTWSKVLISVEDQTERIKAQQEITAHRERLAELVEEKTKDLKQAQETLLKQERFAALGQLTGIVSHELRNPLGTIKSSAYTLREQLKSRENPGITRALNRIERNVLRCDMIIEELMDFHTTRDLLLTYISIDELLKEIISGFNTPEGIILESDLKSKKQIYLDPERFKRCILYLLNNSCQSFDEKKTRRAGNSITVKTRDSKSMVEITVSDNGSGIPQEDLERIFEPLYSTRSFGVGLGLSIVKQIVEQHEGKIEVQSRINSGSKVKILLPINTLGGKNEEDESTRSG